VKIFAQSVPTKWEEYTDLTHDEVTEYFEANRVANEEAVRKLGYTGLHTGALIREGVCDGAATYMVMDSGKTLSLMHMDWMDGYQFQWAHRWTKKDVLAKIDKAERMKQLFKR